jgi:hypothetical protein
MFDGALCVAQVKGDVRLIRSKEFRTEYSLRFPRVTAVRFDKGARDTLTHEALLEDVDRKLARGASRLCVIQDRDRPLHSCGVSLPGLEHHSEHRVRGCKDGG